MRTRGTLLLAVSLWTALPFQTIAHAAEVVPSTAPALEKRLAQYDSRAVAAARHYYEMPAIKAGMIAMVDNVNKAMGELAAKRNPNMTPEQLALVKQVVGDSLKARLDLLLRMNMVVALDTFSVEELVALDTFYSSPVGTAVISKMPQLSAQIPAMIRTIMPDYVNEVRAKLKARGAELKL